MVVRKFERAALSAALLIALSSCEQLHPASVCSDPHTAEEIKGILKKQFEDVTRASMLGDIGIGDHFDLVRMTNDDPSTHKISCEATVHVKVPQKDQDALNSNVNLMMYMTAAGGHMLDNITLRHGEGDVQIMFSRQPSADGDQYIYTFRDNGAIEGLVDFVNTLEGTLALADRQKTENSEPTAAPEPQNAQIDENTVLPPQDVPSENLSGNSTM